MQFVGTWRWCSSLCASGIKGRHCWNEKQMLVRNSPDCSSFFLFSCLGFEHRLTPSPSLLLPLSAEYISTLLFFSLFSYFDTSCTWSYSCISTVTATFSSLLPQADKVFLWLQPSNSWTQRLSAPLMSMEEGKNEKERGVVVTEALSLWGLVSCLTLRFATLTESLFEAERQEEAQLAALCACAALDGLWCCITLSTAVKGGMESSSNFIIQHSLLSHSALSTQHVRESTLSFHGGHPLLRWCLMCRPDMTQETLKHINNDCTRLCHSLYKRPA